MQGACVPDWSEKRRRLASGGSPTRRWNGWRSVAAPLKPTAAATASRVRRGVSRRSLALGTRAAAIWLARLGRSDKLMVGGVTGWIVEGFPPAVGPILRASRACPASVAAAAMREDLASLGSDGA